MKCCELRSKLGNGLVVRLKEQRVFPRKKAANASFFIEQGPQDAVVLQKGRRRLRQCGPQYGDFAELKAENREKS